jgi:proteasome accessory factor A
VYPDLFLENGARMHSDDNRGFVQYATPECDDILQLIAHEKAGERILERLSLSAAANANRRGFKGRMAVFKLSDCTENYLLNKHVKPAQLRNGLIPFLVTRQIFTGAGKVNGIWNSEFGIRNANFSFKRKVPSWEGVGGG